MISQQLLNELKGIVKENYGKDLETREITQIADNLVGYFDLLAKIYHQKKVKNKYDNKYESEKQ
jgi:hypothetical protein